VPSAMTGKAIEKSRARLALERTSGLYAVATGVVEVGKVLRGRWREAHSYAITITSEDAMYQDVHDWLLDNVPVENQHKLAAHSSVNRSRSDADTIQDELTRTAQLYLTYDSRHEQTIVIDGHKVKVSLERVTDADARRYRTDPDKIIFTAASLEGQQSVRRRLEAILTDRRQTKKRPVLWMLSHWGSWQKRSDLPLRTIESVVLREGQMEGLVDDLDEFLSRESDYVRRGIPWHRGYLLQGPPGTGKTSIAKALANHFGLDLWYAPLGDIDKDTNLLSLLAEVHPRSMLLLEDVDIYHAATSREAETGQLSLSGLLNALDGVSTPHGLITVLTSNEPKVLDDALVRPGRIDRIEDVDYVTQEQAKRLFEYFYGRRPAWKWSVGAQASTADLVEVFKNHLDDPVEAERAMQEREGS
jgi:hypothetical protein